MRGEDARGTEGVSGREARLWICGALVLEAGLGRGLEGHKACPAWVLQIWVGRGGDDYTSIAVVLPLRKEILSSSPGCSTEPSDQRLPRKQHR